MRVGRSEYFFILVVFVLLYSCGKSFSGGILEKKNNNNDVTYIQADGKSYLKLGFGEKVDVQPYIAFKEGAYTIALRGEYEGWKNIYFTGLLLADDQDSIAAECEKRYIRGLIIQMEVCDAFLVDDLATLKMLLDSPSVEVMFVGEEGRKVVFTMSKKQKEVFDLIFDKYDELTASVEQ